MDTYLGFIAATLTTISFIPQVVRTLKTRRTKDISLSMYSIFSIGVFGWLIYGIIRFDPPVIAANAITFILALMILYLKISNRHKE